MSIALIWDHLSLVLAALFLVIAILDSRKAKKQAA